MESLKIIYKLIDHDNKKIHKYCVYLHLDRNVQWREGKDAEQKYLEWVRAEAALELELCKHSDKFVSDYMGNSGRKFSDFHEVSRKGMIFMGSVNITPVKGEGADMTPQEGSLWKATHNMKKLIMKYSVGKAPENWHSIYNYDHCCVKMLYKVLFNGFSMSSIEPLKCDGDSNIIKIKNFTVPAEKMVGGYDDSYYNRKLMKYKKKIALYEAKHGGCGCSKN